MSEPGQKVRRRLLLYGLAAALAAGVLLLPRFLPRLTPALKTRNLIAEADAVMKTEAVERLQELLRIDSSNPPGDTRAAILGLARLFDCEGIPGEIVGDDPTRPILVARLRGLTEDGALLLLNHVDVVPPEDLSKWDRPPFSGERGSGRAGHYLYGRGALDMKAQIIAGFLAMADLKRRGVVPRRDIVFVAESAEESFELQYGIGWVLERRPDLLAGVTDAVNEGGVNEVLGSGIVRYGIEVLQKAIVSVWIDAPTPGPLEAFRKFLEEKDRSSPLHLDPTVKEFLRFIAPTRSDVWGRSMLGSGESILGPKLLREIPEVYRSLLRDAIYAGSIGPAPGGGFTFRAVRMLLPGSPVKANHDELLGWAKERGLRTREHLVTYDAVASPATGRAWDALTAVFGLDAFEPAPVGIYILNGAFTSSPFLRARGRRVFGISPFNINFYDASKIHNANERISLPHYVEGVERFRAFVAEYALAP
ncbi:MAG TPA: M20/M25/M40 family metallo-hydrolase [Thermoanaerobaculia bacterium]|nr:M20/M25/M40 family metallo-hydrolase [Thermoanaerobaculia bacterium]